MSPHTFRAPGRVNVMGDHTDYNAGLVLPMAIDRACEVAAVPNHDGVVRARSAEFDGVIEVPLDTLFDPRTTEPPWGRFVAGVVAAVAARGVPLAGVDLSITSTVPAGSGLSSSSALSVALAIAISERAGLELEARELAQVALDGEVLATGVPGGLMDQVVALLGEAGHALMIDCRTLAVRPVAIDAGVAVLVAHCGVPRTLADSAYAARRAECESIARRLGVASLRDASADAVDDEPRARHVVTENARVVAAADALAGGDLVTLGRLMLESHASLRDDYEVSTPELDHLVAALVAAGAAGARLTGAGFGGCVVAVTATPDADVVLTDAVRRYRDVTGIGAAAFVAHAVDGARR